MTAVTTRRPLSTITFYVVVVLGLVAGVSLLVYDVLDKPPVRLESMRTRKEDNFARVQVLARSFSDTQYCIEVTITATNPDGYTLAEKLAAPTSGSNVVRPRQQTNFVAEFDLDDMDERQFREEVDEYVAVVSDREEC